MKKRIIFAVTAATVLSASSLFAAGADTNGAGTLDYSFILDRGNSVSFTRTSANPKITGTDADGVALSDGFKAVNIQTIEAKWDYNGTMIGIRTGRPYGVDLTYADGALTGTGAEIKSNELGIVASRGINQNLKFFGGVRINSFSGQLSKPFLAAALGGTYSYTLENTTSTGFTVGAAYEIPEIYLRASVQYNSEIKHGKVKQFESIGGVANPTQTVEMTAPAATTIKLRTALSKQFVVFGSWRSAIWSKYKIEAPVNTAAEGGPIWDPSSGIDYTVGGAFVVSDSLTVLGGISRNPKDSDSGTATNPESALFPTNGSSSTFLGVNFKVADNVELNAVYSLTNYGDALAGVPSLTQAGGAGLGTFSDNSVNRVTLGTKISF